MWGMFVYKEETSTVAMMVSGGKGVDRDWIMSRKWIQMGGEGFNEGLEVGIDVSRDAFVRGTIGGDDGVAWVAVACGEYLSG